MGQGAHHLGVSLAPAPDKSSWAGASCASSLPAGAGAVTMRLAQMLPQLRGTVGAAIDAVRAATIRRRELGPCVSHAARLAHIRIG